MKKLMAALIAAAIALCPSVTMADLHTHTLEYVEAVPAGCETEGNAAYYRCTVCGELFLDATATIPTTAEEVTLPPAGHDWGEWRLVREPTETESGMRCRYCKNDLGSNGLVVTLDPGHGYYDNRGYYTEYYEGRRMFTLTSYLKTDLEEYSNVVVYTTRETINDDCELGDRGKLAAENGSELFISMHSNWAQSSEAMGVSVYRSFLRPESDELGTLLGLAVTDVINGVTGETYMRNDGHPMIRTEPAYGEEYGDGVTQDYYNVTRMSVMSEKCRYSYIIEHGFHSNPKECAFLLSDENLQSIAAAECAVIAEYFGLYKDGEELTGARHVQYDEIPPLSELGPVEYDLPDGMTMDASAAFYGGTIVTVRQTNETAPAGYETLFAYDMSAAFFDCAVQSHGPVEIFMQTDDGDRIALYYKNGNGMEEVPFAVVSGTAHATLDRCGTYFIVRLPAELEGDVDCDGDVSNKDVVALFRYVSGASVTVDETAADFNGDGSVDNRDVTDLFKYVSKS